MVLLQLSLNFFTFAKEKKKRKKKEKERENLKNKSWDEPSSKKIKVLKREHARQSLKS